MHFIFNYVIVSVLIVLFWLFQSTKKRKAGTVTAMILFSPIFVIFIISICIGQIFAR
jgi:hypothetical protein